MRTVALFCAALALCAGASARAPKIGNLRSYETPTYTLIIADKFSARRFVPRIADFERVLAKMLAKDVRPTGTPTYVYVVSGDVWNRYLQPSRDIVGEFVPRRFVNYLLLNTEIGRSQLRDAVFHEYTHFFLHTQFQGYYPLWFDEGLAELMMHTKIYGNQAIVGRPSFGGTDCWVPLSRLLNIDKSSPEYLLQPASHCVHRESWALVHRGLIAEPAFGDRIFKYLQAVNEMKPIEDAAQDCFGVSVAQLDTTTLNYLRQRMFKVGEISFEPAPRIELGPGRQLAPSEAYESLARVMLDTGFNPQHVGELIDAAEQFAPGSPAVAVLRLRVAVRDRDDAAMTRLAQSLADTNDTAIVRGVGLALFERVREEAPQDSLSAAERAQIGEKAFALLDRALRANPGDAEAAWGYALLAARFKADLDGTLERLAFVKARVPENADLSMATALVHEARETTDLMLPHLIDTLRFSKSVEQRYWAAKRIVELRGIQKKSAPQ